MHHHFFFVGWTMGMQLRISTTTILYDKILRLRLSSLGQVPPPLLVAIIDPACDFVAVIDRGRLIARFDRAGLKLA